VRLSLRYRACTRSRARHPGCVCTGDVACGAGLKSAKALVEPMLKDPVDYVRQGACIAMAMVMVQQPEDDVTEFRKHLEATIADKHEDSISKMGAIMAAGILDASALRARLGCMDLPVHLADVRPHILAPAPPPLRQPCTPCPRARAHERESRQHMRVLVAARALWQ
jgi:hypothetical protein